MTNDRKYILAEASKIILRGVCPGQGLREGYRGKSQTLDGTSPAGPPQGPVQLTLPTDAPPPQAPECGTSLIRWIDATDVAHPSPATDAE